MQLVDFLAFLTLEVLLMICSLLIFVPTVECTLTLTLTLAPQATGKQFTPYAEKVLVV